MKRRAPPTKKNYRKLTAGKSMECSVVLVGYDMKEKGTYTIQFSGNEVSRLPASNIIEIKVI